MSNLEKVRKGMCADEYYLAEMALMSVEEDNRDEDLCLPGVSKHPNLLRRIPHINRTLRLCKAAYDSNPRSYAYIPPLLRNQENFVKPEEAEYVVPSFVGDYEEDSRNGKGSLKYLKENFREANGLITSIIIDTYTWASPWSDQMEIRFLPLQEIEKIFDYQKSKNFIKYAPDVINCLCPVISKITKSIDEASDLIRFAHSLSAGIVTNESLEYFVNQFGRIPMYTENNLSSEFLKSIVKKY